MTSFRRKQLRHLKKQIRHLPKKEQDFILKSAKGIQDNPHICTKCWSGSAYFEGRLVCDCWPEAELKAYEVELNAGLIILDKEENDVRYYKRKL